MDGNKKILVVEDEVDILGIIRLRLEHAGYVVITASNGQEALDKLKRDLPDLIVSDVLMPVMDGFSFYKELKKTSATAEIPVLILTSRSKMEDSFRVVGADDFLAKPFDYKELLDKAAHLLHQDTPRMTMKAPPKVLVAGSDEEVVADMVALLKKAGCLTDMVTRGPELISRAVLFSPAIIVMEVQMYGMPAEEIIRILRQMPDFGRVPILVYSFYRLSDLGSEGVRQKALSVDAAREACLENGATAYLGRYNDNTFVKFLKKYF